MMSCEFNEKTKWYSDNFKKIMEIEEHIAECDECKALLDRSTAEISFHQPDITDENTFLLNKVLKKKRAEKRILIFCIIGMIMGFFSYTYSGQSIFILKLIMAIPYKLAEMFFMYAGPYTNMFMEQVHMGGRVSARSEILYQVSMMIVPSIIGGCIYGSIGYLTEKKDVFTLKKFALFILKWAIVLILSIGIILGLYKNISDDTYKLEKITGFEIHYSTSGKNYNSTYSVYKNMGNKKYEALIQSLRGKKKMDNLYLNSKEGMTPLNIYGQLYYKVSALLDAENNLIYMDNGYVYSVPDSFADEYLNVDFIGGIYE